MRELLKNPLRLLVPVDLRRWLKFKIRGEKYTPPLGAVRFGDLRRLTPICRAFGEGRGVAVDRVYVEDFLARNRADIRGKVRQQVTLIGRRLVPLRPDVVMWVADGKSRLERGFRSESQPGWLADSHV